jgi:spermidine synthase
MDLRKKLFGLFFLSGFCGLLYQVVWVRLAFAHFGVITPVLSVIVSVFMLGLAVGSWASGKWVSPVTARLGISAATAYAACEFLIGLGAFAVPRLFERGEMLLLPGGEMNSASYLLFSALIMTAAILPWCLCMGATFPLMMAFIKERRPSSTESFSFLYLANVLGAVTGTILTADVLVELLGFRHTLLVAGGLNFLIAAVSITLASDAVTPATGAMAGAQSNVLLRQTSGGDGEKPRWLGLILFTTGFVSMSSEVIWTRAFTPILNTTIYAFALVLAVYLTATAAGSYLYRRQLRQGEPFSNAALLAWLALSSFLPIVLNDPRLDLRTFGVEVSLFPLCTVLGYLTPKIIDQYSQGRPDSAGRAYAINVVGCVIGPLFASYVLLPACGVKLSLVWMAVPLAMLFAVSSLQLSVMARSTSALAVGALFVLTIKGSISHEEKYPGGVVRRDHTATVISAGSGMDRHLYVNGQGITTLSTITKSLGHMPLAFFRGVPRNTLTICFGMGTTYRSLLSWGIKTTAVELVPSVKTAFGYYHADAQEVLKNPLGTIVIDDGRRFLKRTSETFDVVTIDPPPPVEAAGSSLLYSTEFYATLKQRLSPGGILQQWFPGGEGPEAQAIGRSLTVSFPHVRVYRSLAGEGLLYLASMQPLEAPSVEAMASRMPEKARKDLLEWETDDLKTVLRRMLSQEVPLAQIVGEHPDRIITDDHPYNEYYLLRRSWIRAQRTYRARGSEIRT